MIWFFVKGGKNFINPVVHFKGTTANNYGNLFDYYQSTFSGPPVSIFESEEYDTNSNFSGSTSLGRFTAPVTGTLSYSLSFYVKKLDGTDRTFYTQHSEYNGSTYTMVGVEYSVVVTGATNSHTTITTSNTLSVVAGRIYQIDVKSSVATTLYLENNASTFYIGDM